MGRRVRILTSLEVSRLRGPGLFFVGVVPGLAISVKAESSRSWILRYYQNGRRRDMGLGPYPEVSLAQARDSAAAKRALIREGVDPIEQRKEARAELRSEIESRITFEDAAGKYIESHRRGWKSAKHSLQWGATLEKYAYPVIGSKSAREIELQDILKVIEPIWESKTETASRLRGRIESILDWATVRGYRDGANPARWKGNLDMLLPARNKISKVRHFDALPWTECAAFYAQLKKRKGISAEALKFCILTACRSGEVRGARWSEFDVERRVWTIPAERMKAGREHRVPLSDEVAKLLEALPRFPAEDLVFANSRGGELSNMALLQMLRGVRTSCTVHGFRSSFRDWAGESTGFPREVIEHALAHQLKDKAEAAYARGDLFAKRVGLMEAWANYLHTGEHQ